MTIILQKPLSCVCVGLGEQQKDWGNIGGDANLVGLKTFIGFAQKMFSFISLFVLILLVPFKASSILPHSSLFISVILFYCSPFTFIAIHRLPLRFIMNGATAQFTGQLNTVSAAYTSLDALIELHV